VRERWLAPGRRLPPQGQACEAGRRFEGDGLQIEALAPPPLASHGVAAPCVLRIRDAAGRELWHASDANPWVARRLVAQGEAGVPARAGVEPGKGGVGLLAGPATLAAWRTILGAEVGVATRLPGPSLRRRWPEDAWHTGVQGALRVRPEDWPEGGWSVRAWRAQRARWWDGPGA
jgi:hypothetical protein